MSNETLHFGEQMLKISSQKDLCLKISKKYIPTPLFHSQLDQGNALDIGI
jgi:hypothetical protein